MMDSQATTIDTLTASVAVLQMGKRQVTLSVYKQLDAMFAGDMAGFTPFGRVRSNEWYRDEDWRTGKSVTRSFRLELVGRDDRTGQLVKMQLTHDRFREMWSGPDSEPGEPEWLIRMGALPLLILAGAR